MKKTKMYSNDTRIKGALKEYKKKEKLYERINNTLNILGDFSRSIEVYLYKEIKNDEKQQIKLWCGDDKNRIFIFCPASTDKNDTTIIECYDNNSNYKYNIALLKKHEITNDNIGLARFDKQYNFRHGRLITDEKTYYSVFTSNDVAYQIQFANQSSTVQADKVLRELNNSDTISFTVFKGVFEQLFLQENCLMAVKTISAYKDFEMIGHINLENHNEIKKNKKILTK